MDYDKYAEAMRVILEYKSIKPKKLAAMDMYKLDKLLVDVSRAKKIKEEHEAQVK